MTKIAQNTKVTIGVLTYNHESYIEECLESVVSQVGDFELRIIVVNDRSKDKTDSVIKKFIKRNKQVAIEYFVNETNLGAQKSIYKTLGLIKATKPDFWSYIEGDDKYLSPDRTQKHINLLTTHESAIMSYNKLKLIDENSQLIVNHEPDYFSDTITTSELASQNLIGSFCATFYSARAFDHFNPEEFTGLTVYDWFFNIWMSQFGEIRQLGEYLTGYRQHSASVWSSMSQTKQYWELIWSIDSYNKKLNFEYDESFQSYKRNLVNQLSVIENPMGADLLVMSGKFLLDNEDFLSEEVAFLLGHNDSIIVTVTGETNNNLAKAAKAYKQANPDIANKVVGYDGTYTIVAKCIYATSIKDAYFYALPVTNTHNTRLVFEISRSEEPKLASNESKKRLKAIFKSVNFVQVIVHSQTTKQYLVQNKLCKESRIALIPSSISEKVYGKDSLYGANQRKSYYTQANNILRRCLSGELQPSPLHPLKRVKMRLHVKAAGLVRRIKVLIRRHRITHSVARLAVKITHPNKRPKE